MLARAEKGLRTPLDSFKHSLFRQPSLAEGRLKPSNYRKSVPLFRDKLHLDVDTISLLSAEHNWEEEDLEVEREVDQLLEDGLASSPVGKSDVSASASPSLQAQLHGLRAEQQRLLLHSDIEASCCILLKCF